MRYIIGIDEVGRGPLAGPVTVTALAVPENLHKKLFIGSVSDFSPLQLKSYNPALLARRLVYRSIGVGRNSDEGGSAVEGFQLILRDSKKLSATQRKKWFRIIKNHPKILYATSSVYPKTIDRINITASASIAAGRALKKLLKHPTFDLRCQKADIFLDYGLKPNLPKKLTTYNLQLKTFARADEIIPAVSLASIVAKVSRDRYMTRQHKNYPEYGFHKNKGYGVRKHIQAIQRYGPSPFHRLTFIKNYPILR